MKEFLVVLFNFKESRNEWALMTFEPSVYEPLNTALTSKSSFETFDLG